LKKRVAACASARISQSRGPQLNTSQNPDEQSLLGAAIQAEILSGGFQKCFAARCDSVVARLERSAA